jgi:hypothetical protein
MDMPPSSPLAADSSRKRERTTDDQPHNDQEEEEEEAVEDPFPEQVFDSDPLEEEEGEDLFGDGLDRYDSRAKR